MIVIIVDYACNLIINIDNIMYNYLVTLKDGKPLDDPDALLQQYIPKSYLSLQNKVEKKSLEMKEKNLAPMMHVKEFQ